MLTSRWWRIALPAGSTIVGTRTRHRAAVLGFISLVVVQRLSPLGLIYPPTQQQCSQEPRK
jgi:hypothetical protein